MNWQILLKKLKENGYTGGESDLAAVKSFVADKFDGIQSEGKTVDIDALHAAAHPAKKSLDMTADARDAAFNSIVNAEVEKRLAVTNELNGANKANKGGNTEAKHDISVGKERAADDKAWGYKSIGHLAMDVYQRGPGTGMTKAMEAASIVAKAQGLNQTIGSDGGFLVPPQFSQLIWDGMQKGENNLLSQTDGYTVDGESLTMNANAETSRATGSRWGGIRGYWISETQQITKSSPKLRQVKIEPKELAVLCYATDKLIRNASALSQWLGRAASSEINFLTGDSIINGTGAGQPLGIVTSPGKVSVEKEAGQPAASIIKENIDKMWARMHANWRSGAVWWINQDCEPQLDNLNMGVGTGGVPVYLPPGGISDTPYARLKGRPVIPIEFCATCGTQGDIILANPSAYCSGTGGNGVDTAMSMHLRFDYAETAFRFMFAVDGQPWIAAPMTPFKGTATISPFVVLDNRA